MWVFLSSCYPAVSSGRLACQTLFPLAGRLHTQWHINSLLCPCHSPHTASPPSSHPLPPASTPHMCLEICHSQFPSLLDIMHSFKKAMQCDYGVSNTLLSLWLAPFSPQTGELPWCQRPAVKQRDCARWWLWSGVRKCMQVLHLLAVFLFCSASLTTYSSSLKSEQAIKTLSSLSYCLNRNKRWICPTCNYCL